MPSIRHVAIMCENPSVQAEFYKTVFDLHEVWRHGPSVYLSDVATSMEDTDAIFQAIDLLVDATVKTRERR